MDSLFPSASNYKINIQINNLTLNDCSYVTSDDKIRPFFENTVSKDQDVTGLMVFLRNSNGAIEGKRVLYTLEQEDSQQNDYDYGSDIIIFVKSLDDPLPLFPVPEGLPPGMYTMVSQVMRGKNVLQRIEKSFYYLNSMDFSYNSIDTYLPGITESAQLIPRGTMVMLEANLDFIDSLDPYIIWYEGKNRISEGNYSDGAGQLFWKAPEQSGFFYLCAEVFPKKTEDRLIGYKKEISLLVSSIAIDVHLISNNIQQLIHWYTFEGSLNDSKMAATAERALKPAGGNTPKWMGFKGTYGLVTGKDNIINLPKITVSQNSKNANNTWQILSRFNPLNDGEIFSVFFGESSDDSLSEGGVCLQLFKDGLDIILTLTSSAKTVSQVYSFPEPPQRAQEAPGLIEQILLEPNKTSPEALVTELLPSDSETEGSLDEIILNTVSEYSNPSAEESNEYYQDISFLVAGVSFTILPQSVSAYINILSSFPESKLTEDPAVIEINIVDEFQILLGFQNNNSDADEIQTKADSVVIWDEFALYYMPPPDFFSAKTVESEDGEEP